MGQADSVKNQYEHFLSLLQAHCSMVADRYVQDEEEVREELGVGTARCQDVG